MSVLENNLAILERKNPSLAEMIRQAEPAGCEIIPCKNGEYNTIKVNVSPKKSTLLHSRYDPIKEAQRSTEHINLDNVINIIYLGFGAGFHIRALAGKIVKGIAVHIIEQNISILRAAFEANDLHDILNNDSIYLHCGVPANLVKEHFDSYILNLALHQFYGSDVLFLEYAQSVQTAPEYYRTIRSTLEEMLGIYMILIKTNCEYSNLYYEQMLGNIRELATQPGVTELIDIWKGKPVICVAAGPSLDKSIPLLKKARGKALIIAADTAYHIMSRQNVFPDIVCMIDFHKWNKWLYRDVVYPKDKEVLLVCDPKVSNDVVAGFPYGKFIYDDSSTMMRWLSEFCGAKGVLPRPMSVAHLSFNLARAMGADPIILFSHDMAFTHGTTYASGSAYEEFWMSEINRFFTMEMKEQMLIEEERKRGAVWVSAIGGGKVLTSPALLGYLRELESQIRKTESRVIDASSGALKQGTTVMSPEEVVKEFCAENQPVSEVLTGAVKAGKKEITPELKNAIREMSEKMDKISAAFRENADVIRNVQKQLKNNPGSNPLKDPKNIKLLSKAQAKLKEHYIPEIESILREYDQNAVAVMVHNDRIIEIATARDGFDKTVSIRLERDNQYYSSMSIAAADLAKHLKNSHEKLTP